MSILVKVLGRESEKDGEKLGREMVAKGCIIESRVLWFLMRETGCWGGHFRDGH